MIAPGPAAEVHGEHARRGRRDDVVVHAVADVGDRARPQSSSSANRAKNAGSGLRSPSPRRSRRDRQAAAATPATPRLPRAGCPRPTRIPPRAAVQRARGVRVDVVELLVTRHARRHARRTRARSSNPAGRARARAACGRRSATVAPRREELLPRHADPVGPDAPRALLAEQRLAEVEDRGADHSAARRTSASRARGVVVGPVPLHAVVDHERVAAVVLDPSTSSVHHAATRSRRPRRRPPDRRHRDVAGGEDRQRAARIRPQTRKRLAPQRQREHDRPRPAPDRGRDRDRVRLARARRQHRDRPVRPLRELVHQRRGARPRARAAGWPSRAARPSTCSPTPRRPRG